MIVARWQIEARFGHKQTVIEMLKNWNASIGEAFGLNVGGERLMTGSIGAKEAVVVSELTLDSVADLEAGFSKLGESEAHADWGKDLEPYVVSGSSFWEIYKIVD